MIVTASMRRAAFPAPIHATRTRHPAKPDVSLGPFSSVRDVSGALTATEPPGLATVRVAARPPGETCSGRSPLHPEAL
jgi:hypothetical protein